LNNREELIILTHLDNADKNEQDGKKRESAFTVLHKSGFIDLKQDKKYESDCTYILQYNAYLEYLKYLELQESRKSSKRAI